MGRASNPAIRKPSPIRAVKCTARWKSRKAGERALRYIFSTCYGAVAFGRDFFRPLWSPVGVRGRFAHGLRCCEKMNNLTQRRQGAKTRKEQLLCFLCAFYDFAPLREMLLLIQGLFHSFWRPGPNSSGPPGLNTLGPGYADFGHHALAGGTNS